jgi:hypothetical protein
VSRTQKQFPLSLGSSSSTFAMSTQRGVLHHRSVDSPQDPWQVVDHLQWHHKQRPQGSVIGINERVFRPSLESPFLGRKPQNMAACNLLSSVTRFGDVFCARKRVWMNVQSHPRTQAEDVVAKVTREWCWFQIQGLLISHVDIWNRRLSLRQSANPRLILDTT